MKKVDSCAWWCVVSCVRRLSPTTNVLPSVQPVSLNLALQPPPSPTIHCVPEASDVRHATAAKSSTCLEDAISCRFNSSSSLTWCGEQLANYYCCPCQFATLFIYKVPLFLPRAVLSLSRPPKHYNKLPLFSAESYVVVVVMGLIFTFGTLA